MDQNKKDILKHFKDSGHGFEIPKGYFKKLEHQLQNQVDAEGFIPEKEKRKENRAEKEIFSMSDKRKTGFSVPEGYFDELESNLRIENEKKIFLLTHPKLRILSLSIAASILLFFGIRTLNLPENSTDLNEFNNEDIASWIDSGLVHLDSYEIAEAFSDVELEGSLINEEDLFYYIDEIDVENLMIEN
ncbi:hypothetical protein LCM02_05965 [Lutimonas saemankumensis]|uniref:hypothetical protein n=1 Tax=Lutimonas saemankumensis TaxID=483016 RepID=UPI001CD53455|nr:hypothetical protein [Lutimonas saemankumensis]MCA0931988.1 hypothetical protein [Lutimonas saemankumensis]